MYKFVDNAIAFVDILGYRDLILLAERLGNPESLIGRLDKALTRSFDDKYKIPRHKFKVKLFSDCISVSTELRAENILMLIRLVAAMQRELCMNDIWVRGAISFGKHYENETMIFSGGLIRAYDIERLCSEYPRILIDSEIFCFLSPDEIDYATSKFGSSFIQKDKDGCSFVDYLDNIFHIYKSTTDSSLRTILIHSLQRHKYYIQQYADEIRSRTDLGLKYSWAANYHNRKILGSCIEESMKLNLFINVDGPKINNS